MPANVNMTNGILQWSCSDNPTTRAWQKIGQTIAYCLIFVFSLTGNIFIGIIVYKTKTMRKRTNILIVNMAMSDLLFPIFLIPHKLTELYVDFWPLGEVSCKTLPFLQYASAAVSIQSHVLIAVDRFKAVVFPLRAPLITSKPRYQFRRILVTWIVAMVMWCPFLFAYKLVKKSEGRHECVDLWTNHANACANVNVSASYKNYILVMIAVGIYISLGLVAILYTNIYFKVKSQAMPGEKPANARQLQERLKNEKTVLKMSIAIVLGFAVCYLPYSIVSMLIYFVSDIWSCGFKFFANFALFAARANCAINPCILFLFSKNYRQSLRKLLGCSS